MNSRVVQELLVLSVDGSREEREEKEADRQLNKKFVQPTRACDSCSTGRDPKSWPSELKITCVKFVEGKKSLEDFKASATKVGISKTGGEKRRKKSYHRYRFSCLNRKWTRILRFRFKSNRRERRTGRHQKYRFSSNHQPWCDVLRVAFIFYVHLFLLLHPLALLSNVISTKESKHKEPLTVKKNAVSEGVECETKLNETYFPWGNSIIFMYVLCLRRVGGGMWARQERERKSGNYRPTPKLKQISHHPSKSH